MSSATAHPLAEKKLLYTSFAITPNSVSFVIYKALISKQSVTTVKNVLNLITPFQ